MKKAWLIGLVALIVIGSAWILSQRTTTTNSTSSFPASVIADYEYVCRCKCGGAGWLCAVPHDASGECSDYNYDFAQGDSCSAEDCKKHDGNKCEGYVWVKPPGESQKVETTLGGCSCFATPKKPPSPEPEESEMSLE